MKPSKPVPSVIYYNELRERMIGYLFSNKADYFNILYLHYLSNTIADDIY
jgi:hypothetical protein